MKHTQDNYSVEGQTVLEGLIGSLMQQLATLAPHPDHLEVSAPLFIDSKGDFHPPEEYQSLVRRDFMGAASSPHGRVVSIDAGASLLKKSFAESALRGPVIDAYYHDLPHRLRLESWIASCLRRLYSRRKNALRYVPLMAA